MAITSAGIGSNLPIEELVSGLMAIERKPLAQIQTRTTAMQAKISAMGSVKSSLSSFKDAIAALSSTAGIQPFAAASSDSSSVGISMTGSGGGSGSYAISVTSIAQSQKLATAGQPSATLPIGQGKITFERGTIKDGALGSDGKYTGATFTAGSTPLQTVTIPPGATSLNDIRDAINKSNIGVTASIVNDGGGASPYRLVLTDSATGKSNSLRISVDGDSSLANLLNHNPASATGQALQETRTAKDAEFTLDGLAMSRSTNTITDLIEGAKITLTKPTTTPVALSVTTNNDGVNTSVKKFIDAYNQVSQTLKNATAFDPATRKAATLNGDPTVRALQSQLHSLLTTPVSGTGTPIGRLFDIGVSMNVDGTLQLDNAKLQSVLASNPTAVASIFAEVAVPTDPEVSYVGSTTKTQPGDFAVTVGQLATRGMLTGSAPASLTVTAGQDDTFEVKLNGVSASIKLAAGTYTATALASEIQQKINTSSAFVAAGLGVTVSESSGTLSVQSTAYGSTSTVEITASASASNPSLYFGATPVTTAGTDITGTINGVAAVGSGQFLTGATGDGSEGLKLRVTGGLENSARGNVHYSHGYAFKLGRALEQILGTGGAIANATNGFSETVKQLDKDREKINARLTATEARFRKQFTSLDVLMGQASATSSYLTQQLSALARSNSGQ